MALHNVSKQPGLEGPSPNKKDVILDKARRAHGTNSVNYQTASTSAYYIVQAGDTITSIALAFGLSVAQVEALNPQIANFNLIFPGQVVYISNANPGLKAGNLRLVASGTVTMTNDGATNTNGQTFAHNLGYKPLLVYNLVSDNFTDGLSTVNNVDFPLWIPVNMTIPASGGSAITFNKLIIAFVDDSTVYFRYYNTVLDGDSHTVTFYLYQQGTNPLGD